MNAKDRKVVATLVTVIAVALAAVCLTSCSQEDPEPMAELNVTVTPPEPMNSRQITFACLGDFSFSTSAFTRSLTADGKDMTDLWVLDYQGTTLIQQLHQTADDADFGTPTLNLSIGDHHIYFVASRGQSPTLSTEDHTITFSKILDTFYKDYSLSVTATSSGNRAVTLDRAVTKLKVTMTDAIPADAATFNLTPHVWYYGINYFSGEPCAAQTDQTVILNVPAASIGKTGEYLNLFGFSSATEWTTDVNLTCETSAGAVLGSAALVSVPLKRNRITSYSGPLFSAAGLTSVSLSTDWETEYTATW